MLATTAGQTIFVAIPRVAFGALEGLKDRYCWLHNHGLSESLDRRLSSAADSKRFQPPSYCGRIDAFRQELSAEA
jgi:hypothetical protein